VTSLGRHPSVEDILAVLDAGDDGALRGVYESATLDFKGAYHFGDDRERWEFGKDVAAMANGDGGVIVVGVHTEPDPAQDEERATAVKPFRHELFDTTRAARFLDTDVYPPIDGVRILPFEREGGRRLVAVVVPPQPDDQKPFLLSKVIDNDGRGVDSFVVPRRSGSHTVYAKVGTVHRDIADGRRHRRTPLPTTASTSSDSAGRRTGGVGHRGNEPLDAAVVPVHRLESAPTLPDDAATPPAPIDAADIAAGEQWLNDTADLLDREHNAIHIPMLYVAAISAGARRRPADFFTVDGLRTALNTSRTLRRNGFGLTYGANIRPGALSILSVDEDRTLLRVDHDGHAINAAAGTRDHLCWAQSVDRTTPAGPEALRINVVALSEFVYEFCRFVPRELATRWGADGWMLGVTLRRAASADPPLALPARWGTDAWLFDARPAETDERFDVFEASLDPAVDAVAILRTIYSVFTLNVDANPFVDEERFNEQKLIGS
jgi:hypothetical protein